MTTTLLLMRESCVGANNMKGNYGEFQQLMRY